VAMTRQPENEMVVIAMNGTDVLGQDTLHWKVQTWQCRGLTFNVCRAGYRQSYARRVMNWAVSLPQVGLHLYEIYHQAEDGHVASDPGILVWQPACLALGASYASGSVPVAGPVADNIVKIEERVDIAIGDGFLQDISRDALRDAPAAAAASLQKNVINAGNFVEMIVLLDRLQERHLVACDAASLVEKMRHCVTLWARLLIDDVIIVPEDIKVVAQSGDIDVILRR